jgi:hypothetical protein
MSFELRIFTQIFSLCEGPVKTRWGCCVQPPHPLVPRLIIMTEVGCVLVLELVVVVTAAAAAVVVVEVEVVAFVVVGLCGNA